MEKLCTGQRNTSSTGGAGPSVTFDVAADLARLERGSSLLAFDDFTGCFWGHVPDADDTAGATQTLKFPRVILSNKVKEWRKSQNVADKAAKCGNRSPYIFMHVLKLKIGGVTAT